MAKPGKIAKYSLPKIKYLKWSLTIPPQLETGGWTPIPKKLKPLSIKIALAKFAAKITIVAYVVYNLLKYLECKNNKNNNERNRLSS